MKRPIALLPAALVVLALAATACQSDGAEPETTAPATPAAATPDTAKIDQVKAGSFVIGFRGAFPSLAAGRDDAAITSLFTATCADIRAGEPEDAATTAITERLGGATPQEAQAVYQMVAAMCGPH
ncbi:hypothetical protein [Nocardia carnea]|uniref:hypothetical protein n=1 Tax=Nocardia carnea TaxID=37328 RepID=UPI0024575F5A|nr:hypothetical protein [Nocardia carnea]